MTAAFRVGDTVVCNCGHDFCEGEKLVTAIESGLLRVVDQAGARDTIYAKDATLVSAHFDFGFARDTDLIRPTPSTPYII